jgi:hypothetical protein
MLDEIIANVEKELNAVLTQDERVTAESLIKKGFDSKSVAETLTSYNR